MKWNDLLVQILVYALFVAPMLPILRLWRAAFGVPRMPAPHMASLTGATLSHGLLLAGLLEAKVIGPDYSDRRFMTIGINAGVMAVAAIVSAIVRSPQRRKLVVTCVWLTCAWLVIGAVSSAV
jgi:hypothetical protein